MRVIWLIIIQKKFAKIAVTGTDGSKITYEYQKNKSIVTPETA